MANPLLDPNFVDKIVHEVKAQGIFDEFRKDSMADVDTKPAYQNLHQRVESQVAKFLSKETWTPETNKNQLREKLRKHIAESGYLDVGVERIVDQVVNPKINTVFLPRIETVIYNYCNVPASQRRPQPPEPPHLLPPLPPLPVANAPLKIETASLLPNDLEQISPDSDKSIKYEYNEDKSAANENADVDDDDESPPFEPIGKLSSPIKDESDIEDKDTYNELRTVNDLAKEVSELLAKKTGNNEYPVSTDTQENSMSSERCGSRTPIPGVSHESELSQISSEAISTSNISPIGIVDDKSQIEKEVAVNISEEAQMPKFPENSNETESKQSADKEPLHFDIKKDEIKFEGTYRKPNIFNSPYEELDASNKENSEIKSEFDFRRNDDKMSTSSRTPVAEYNSDLSMDGTNSVKLCIVEESSKPSVYAEENTSPTNLLNESTISAISSHEFIKEDSGRQSHTTSSSRHYKSGRKREHSRDRESSKREYREDHSRSRYEDEYSQKKKYKSSYKNSDKSNVRSRSRSVNSNVENDHSKSRANSKESDSGTGRDHSLHRTVHKKIDFKRSFNQENFGNNGNNHGMKVDSIEYDRLKTGTYNEGEKKTDHVMVTHSQDRGPDENSNESLKMSESNDSIFTRDSHSRSRKSVSNERMDEINKDHCEDKDMEVQKTYDEKEKNDLCEANTQINEVNSDTKNKDEVGNKNNKDPNSDRERNTEHFSVTNQERNNEKNRNNEKDKNKVDRYKERKKDKERDKDRDQSKNRDQRKDQSKYRDESKSHSKDYDRNKHRHSSSSKDQRRDKDKDASRKYHSGSKNSSSSSSKRTTDKNSSQHKSSSSNRKEDKVKNSNSASTSSNRSESRQEERSQDKQKSLSFSSSSSSKESDTYKKSERKSNSSIKDDHYENKNMFKRRKSNDSNDGDKQKDFNNESQMSYQSICSNNSANEASDKTTKINDKSTIATQNRMNIVILNEILANPATQFVDIKENTNPLQVFTTASVKPTSTIEDNLKFFDYEPNKFKNRLELIKNEIANCHQIVATLSSDSIENNNNNNNIDKNQQNVIRTSSATANDECVEKKPSIDKRNKTMQQTLPLLSDNLKENEMIFKKTGDTIKAAGIKNSNNKSNQQQRYLSEDLYKPRPILGQRTKRRGME